jgi:hypothetical protein
VAPYTVDGATLHLWHLNEGVVPCVDSVSTGTNLTSRVNGATITNTSFASFGTALSTIDGGQNGTSSFNRDASLSPRTLSSGTSDNVVMEYANSTNGAFTFEAIVRVNFNPALDMGSGGTGRNSGMQIISGEGDVSGERLFQWRLDPVGFAAGVPSDTNVCRLEFINLFQEVAIQNIAVSIPTNGPNAIASNKWFHVAVAYNGNENTSNNVSFYWTLLDTNQTVANLIGTDSMANDLATGVACDFVVGNEGRSTGGASDNWIGLIDEVRMSSVARGPFDFLFAGDADHDGLPDPWEIQYFTNITAYGAADDPDNDTYSNLQEFQAGSNPMLASSIPNDADGDGLPDDWEMAYFGSLSQGPSDDTDGDGFNNLAELQAGTNPSNAVSNPNDLDADGLPDAWEMQYFGSLALGGNNDPDADG